MLPRAGVALFLEVPTAMDGALGNLMEWLAALPTAKGLEIGDL